MKKQREQIEKANITLETKTVAPENLNQIATSTILTTTTTKTVTEPKESQKQFFHPVRHVGKQTTPKRKATLEPVQPIDRFPGPEDRKDRIRSKREPINVTGLKLIKRQTNL